jgi:hypothetical protein
VRKYPNDTLLVGSFATEATPEIVLSRVLGHVGQHHSIIFVPNLVRHVIFCNNKTAQHFHKILWSNHFKNS